MLGETDKKGEYPTVLSPQMQLIRMLGVRKLNKRIKLHYMNCHQSRKTKLFYLTL